MITESYSWMLVQEIVVLPMEKSNKMAKKKPKQTLMLSPMSLTNTFNKRGSRTDYLGTPDEAIYFE